MVPILLTLFGCGMYVPSCDEEATELGWDEGTPAGLSGADLEAAAGGTWDEELAWEEGGTTSLEVRVEDLSDAVWLDSVHTRARWYHRSQASLLVFCNDSLEVDAVLSLSSGDGSLDEEVDATLSVVHYTEGGQHGWQPEDAVSFEFRVLLEDWDSLGALPDYEVEGEIDEEYVSGRGWFSPTAGSYGRLAYGVHSSGELEDCTGRDCGYSSSSGVDIGTWGEEEEP